MKVTATIAILVLTIFTFAKSVSAAENLTIAVNGDAAWLSVKAKNASLDHILEHLGKRFGFKIQTQGTQHTKDKISVNYRGSLDSVVSRLMRHTNHLIVRSRVKLAKIVKLVIIAPSPALTSAEVEHATQLSRKESRAAIRRRLLQQALSARGK